MERHIWPLTDSDACGRWHVNQACRAQCWGVPFGLWIFALSSVFVIPFQPVCASDVCLQVQVWHAFHSSSPASPLPPSLLSHGMCRRLVHHSTSTQVWKAFLVFINNSEDCLRYSCPYSWRVWGREGVGLHAQPIKLPSQAMDKVWQCLMNISEIKGKVENTKPADWELEKSVGRSVHADNGLLADSRSHLLLAVWL